MRKKIKSYDDLTEQEQRTINSLRKLFNSRFCVGDGVWYRIEITDLNNKSSCCFEIFDSYKREYEGLLDFKFFKELSEILGHEDIKIEVDSYKQCLKNGYDISSALITISFEL